jgi:hypothetical protein
MEENVGKKDQALRALAGPLALSLGYYRMDGRRGKTGGLATMIAGALIIESAITRTCPLNALLGIDTREKRLSFRRSGARLLARSKK